MEKQNKPDKINLILGLIANFFLPGLGTIIIGKYEVGVIQLGLILACFLVIFSNLLPNTVSVIIILVIIAVWAWALITGIKSIKK